MEEERRMTKKEELIKAINDEYIKLASVDEDADKVYLQVREQLRVHSIINVTIYSPTSGDATAIRYLAGRYAAHYKAIAHLLDQLNEEQEKNYFTWKRGIV